MKADAAAQSDLETLTALNRDYIHSVQSGDVRRFEEILAEDFLCSNPDGSLVGKKQFLEQTARPVTAIHSTDSRAKPLAAIGPAAVVSARCRPPRPDSRTDRP